MAKPLVVLSAHIDRGLHVTGIQAILDAMLHDDVSHQAAADGEQQWAQYRP